MLRWECAACNDNGCLLCTRVEVGSPEERAALILHLVMLGATPAEAARMLAMEDLVQGLIDQRRGSFVGALAVAWRHADGRNRAVLEATFPHVFRL